MYNKLIALKTIIGALFLSFITISPIGWSMDEQHQDTVHGSAKTYLPSNDPFKDVTDALQQAIAHDKLAIIVMGAQWCHDSRGLAKTFKQPAMQSILSERYEVVYIDVGFYNDLRRITEHFGQPLYFATPTVYVVEPKSGVLLNEHSIAKWGAADSVPLDEYIDYFSAFAAIPEPSNLSSTNLQWPIAFQNFRIEQSERLMRGYQLLAPGLKSDDRSKEFVALWREVKTFRMQLQKDIDEIKEQIVSNHFEADHLPRYAAFSWEQK